MGVGVNFVVGNIFYIIVGLWNIEEYVGIEGLNFGIVLLLLVGGV